MGIFIAVGIYNKVHWNVSFKPFSGEKYDQIMLQFPDYVASFAVYITLWMGRSNCQK